MFLHSQNNFTSQSMFTVISSVLQLPINQHCQKMSMTLVSMVVNSSAYQCHQGFTMLTSTPSPQPSPVLVQQMRSLGEKDKGWKQWRKSAARLGRESRNSTLSSYPITKSCPFSFCLFLVLPPIFFSFCINKLALRQQDSQDVRAPSSHASCSSSRPLFSAVNILIHQTCTFSADSRALLVNADCKCRSRNNPWKDNYPQVT